MNCLKQEKMKSKRFLIGAVLIVCLVIAGVCVGFLYDSQSSGGDIVENRINALEIKTPYGRLRLAEEWVPYLRYEVIRGDVTQLNFTAEIAGASVKLFDLYLGGAENFVGYLTTESGEKVPVSVVIHDVLPAEDWGEDEKDLMLTMQEAVNEVLTQLKVEIILQNVQENPKEVGLEVSVETRFGVLTYMDVWNGGLRIVEEEQINGFGSVPGKKEQKLFEISLGGTGDIFAGIYTDKNGQEIPVYLTVSEPIFDMTWTEEERRAIYGMQNVLNDILEQLDLASVEQQKETEPILEAVTVSTMYGTVTYPGQYYGKLRIVQDTSSGFSLSAYATIPGKTEIHLFDILIGVSGDVYAGVLTDADGSKKDVNLNVPDLHMDDDWSEEDRREVFLMQSLLNDFCEQLAISRETEKVEKNTAEIGSDEDVIIQTPYGVLHYPGEYGQRLIVENAGENGNVVCFYALGSADEKIGLFELIFGGTGDTYVGTHTAKNGTTCEVYIVFNEIILSDNWNDEELEIIYAMQEASNYVLDKMEEGGMLDY